MHVFVGFVLSCLQVCPYCQQYQAVWQRQDQLCTDTGVRQKRQMQQKQKQLTQLPRVLHSFLGARYKRLQCLAASLCCVRDNRSMWAAAGASRHNSICSTDPD